MPDCLAAHDVRAFAESDSDHVQLTEMVCLLPLIPPYQSDIFISLWRLEGDVRAHLSGIGIMRFRELVRILALPCLR